jgi:hypothetical protein
MEMTARQELTAEQKRQIRAKAVELQQLHQTLERRSPQERRAAMQAKHDELRAWAEQNGIPLDRLPAPRPGRARAG